jgi:hypothetical protein
MLDSSANPMGSFEGGAVKRTHAGTADFECASPRTKNHCSREERASPASHFLTLNCKVF